MIALTVLALVDALLTRHGLAVGAITEANPVMARLFEYDANVAVLACVGVTLIAGGLLDRSRKQFPWAKVALRLLVATRVAVLGLHAVWIVANWGA